MDEVSKGAVCQEEDRGESNIEGVCVCVYVCVCVCVCVHSLMQAKREPTNFPPSK